MIETINSKGITAAVNQYWQLEKFDISVLLINSGSDVNSKSNTNETPLHIASTMVAKDVVSLLISKGASINVNDAGNYTPLSNAIYDPRT